MLPQSFRVKPQVHLINREAKWGGELKRITDRLDKLEARQKRQGADLEDLRASSVRPEELQDALESLKAQVNMADCTASRNKSVRSRCQGAQVLL